MFTEKYIRAQIEDLAIPAGSTVIIHTSLRAVGKIEGGAEKLLDILADNITSRGGLLCIPTHTWMNLGTGRITLDLTRHETCLGAFPTVALADPRGIRSLNPTHSMAVFGDRKRVIDFIDGEISLQTPTSPMSCYAKILEQGGYVLLVGVGQNSNTCLHSAEEIANLPNRILPELTDVSVKLQDGEIIKTQLHMFDESVHGDVSEKFYMYEPAFRYHAAIKDGFIGEAPVQLCNGAVMKDVILLMASRAPGGDPLACGDTIPEHLYV